MCEQSVTRHHHDSVAAEAKPLSVSHQRMDEFASLVETYLVAEHHLVAAVELAGGAVALPDGRTVTVGRAEFDAIGRESEAGVGSQKGSANAMHR